jgi:hypothetical protein
VTDLARALLDALDDRDLAALAERLGPYLPARDPGGFLTPAGAAEYLGVTTRRIHDLTSARRLVPDGHDGRTPLFARRTLDRYVASDSRP